MGLLIDKKFLVKKSLLILGAICCLTAVTLNAVAMGTDYWIVSKGCSNDDYIGETCQQGNDSRASVMDVNYGLFKGLKSIDIIGPTRYNIYVYCGDGGLCILSCGKDQSERQLEFNSLRSNDSKPFACSSIASQSRFATERMTKLATRVTVEDEYFLDSGRWITTIVFLALTILLQLVSTGLCCFNSLKNPIEWWQGPQGIYGLNTLAVVTSVIHLAVWGALYSQKLSSEIAIKETLVGGWTSETTSLGYSYWLSFASLVLTILCCVAIHFRGALRRFESPSAAGGDDEKEAPGIIFLY